jgi:undecaprenyl-diphosphatase
LEHEARRFDTSILLALRNPADPTQPLGPPWVAEIARDATSLGGASVLTLVTFAKTLMETAAVSPETDSLIRSPRNVTTSD